MQKVTGPLNAVLGGSKVTAKGLKSLRDEVKRLDRVGADLKTFVQLKQQARSAAPAMAEAEKRVADLAAKIKAAEGPTRKLSAEFKRAKSDAAALSRAHQEGAVKLQELRTRLNNAGISTRDLAGGERRLRQDTAAANQELKAQSDRLKTLRAEEEKRAQFSSRWSGRRNAALGASAAGGAAMGAATAAVLPMVGAAKQAMAFESSMTSIGQKADLSRKAVEAMGNRLKAVSDQTGIVPEALATALDGLAAKGLDPKVGEKLLGPMAKASRTYKVDMEDLGSATFAVMDNLKVPAEEAQGILDRLAQGDKVGGVGIGDLSKGLPSLTAIAASQGHTGMGAVDDLVAASEIALKSAANPDEAINNLRNLLLKMESPETQKDFAKFGVDFRKEMAASKAAGKSPIETFVKLAQQAKSKGAVMGDLIQDQQAGLALTALTDNLDKYRAMRASIGQAKGVVDRDHVERMKDASEAVQTLGTEFHNLKGEVGTALGDDLAGLAKGLTPVVSGIRDFAKANPWLVKVAAVLAVVVAVVGGLVLAIGIVVAVVAAAVGAIAAVAAAPAAGIVAIVLATIVGIMLLIGFLNMVWIKIKESFAKLDMKAIGNNVIQGLIDGIRERFAPLMTVIDAVGGMLPKAVKDKLGIKSPSRVFGEVGHHAMTGLEKGILGSSGRPLGAARSVAASLAAAGAITGALPAVAFAQSGAATAAHGPPAAVGGGGSTYNITVNAGPGMDEQALARLVAQEIAKYERGRAARQRSSLSDYGED